MTLSQALSLGVLQGATEFLPVSSSGHLVLARAWWPTSDAPQLLFDLVVHLGTVAAIALVLRSRLGALIRAVPSLLPGREPPDGAETERRWVVLIAVGSVPTALIGLSLRGTVEAMHLRPAWVGAALLITAALLTASERYGRRERGPDALGISDAVTIGIAQGLGVLPGISRSGVTVAAALWRGAQARVAVEFSILLSIPAILGANLLELVRAGPATIGGEIFPLLVGFAAAFVTGVLSLKALQWVVTHRKLLHFAVYCAVVGTGAILLG